MIRERKEREAACTGPTNRHSHIAVTQNTVFESLTMIGREPAMRQTSPTMITARGPNRSSNQPALTAPIPATRFAATPR